MKKLAALLLIAICAGSMALAAPKCKGKVCPKGGKGHHVAHLKKVK